MSEGNPGVPGGFAPGSRIAGYLLEEQIGQGGMAVVFRAHDERLDRTVALKILAPALAADEAFRQRFIRESRAAAAVDDPHIIPVFEAGEASGVLFIAMRFVRGGDVRSLVTGAAGPMPPGRAAEIISQVASALDAAHGRGLVHRDVKPANMLLDASSGAGRPDHVYLSDFGLSKGSLQASGLTGTGTFLGTLDYISPEQIEGKPVDGRADEYALACAAFELLTGVPPFQRDEAMAVMYAQLSEPPPPVTSRRPDLPPVVDAVFARALAKSPADRYANCREFSDALREAFGIRPYDSGPNLVPSGEHPATQLVRPASGPGGGAAAGTAVAGAGAFEGGYTPPGGHGAPSPGYPGGGGQPVGAGYPGGSGYAGSGTAGGQGGYAGPGYAQGPGGPAVPGGPGGQPAGPGSSGPGGFGAAPTQLAGGGRSTSPDLTAQQQYAGQGGGGYGDYPAVRRRPWWRSPFALIGALVVLLAGGAVYASVALGGSGGGSSGGGNKHHQLTSIAVPGCSTAAAASKTLSAKTSSVPVPAGKPFGVVASKDGKAVFVATDGSLTTYAVGPGGKLTEDGWHYPIGTSQGVGPATTMVQTSDGKYLLVAANNGIEVLDANGAENGAGTVNVVTLTVPGLTKDKRAIGVAVTPDSKFAFVSLQHAGQVAVFDLAKSLSAGSGQYIGSLDAGPQPVGLTMAPDGKTLYATNFVNDNANLPGTLSVIDVAKATTPGQQKNAVINQVKTACGPARVVVTPDGSRVWVTLRQSNVVLGYSAALLAGSTPGKALQLKAQVGQNPVGLALVNGGSRLIATDTDNNAANPTAADQNLAVVDISGSGQPKLVGYIPSNGNPRDVAVSPDGKYLYVTDRDASQLQVVKLSTIP